MARCTVERLMRELGIPGAVRGKKVHHHDPGRSGQRAPDLVDRDFVAPAPNRCWVADFTHVHRPGPASSTSRSSWTPSPAGSSAGPPPPSKETQLVLDALEMALWQRDRDEQPVRTGELIHHSDAGSQYTSFPLAEHLDAAGIAASIGSVGDAYDNALMESARSACSKPS